MTALKFRTLSGPNKQALFSVATPPRTIPDTTNPTPSTTNVSFISNSKGYSFSFYIEISVALSIDMKSVSLSKPLPETLETGKIGHTFPEELISSAVFASS